MKRARLTLSEILGVSKALLAILEKLLDAVIQAAHTNQVDSAEMDGTPICFVAMPLAVKSLEAVYRDFIKPTLEIECDLRTERGDDAFGSNVVMDDVIKSIRNARLIVADLTGGNPNVCLEVGIALTLGKPVLLITQSMDDVPFDLALRRALVYENTPDGCIKFANKLSADVKLIFPLFQSETNNSEEGRPVTGRPVDPQRSRCPEPHQINRLAPKRCKRLHRLSPSPGLPGAHWLAPVPWQLFLAGSYSSPVPT